MNGPELSKLDLSDRNLYINRELSHIEFNRRVLQEAMNVDIPLLERVRLLAIYSSNMDEFFMVRVQKIKIQEYLESQSSPLNSRTITGLIQQVHETVSQLTIDELACWKSIYHELDEVGIHIRNYDELKPEVQEQLNEFYMENIFPVMTPLAIDPGHPFPHMSNLSLNLGVILRYPEDVANHFARVKIPEFSLPRLLPLSKIIPEMELDHEFVWLEQVIAFNLTTLFPPPLDIEGAYLFRVTRGSISGSDVDEADNLLMAVEEDLRRRRFQHVIRLETEKGTPDSILEYLTANLQMDLQEAYTVHGPLALSCLWDITKLNRPELKYRPFIPKRSLHFQTDGNVFDTLRHQDVVVKRPYDSFYDILKLIDAAADDPDVLVIKMTLYRIDRDSEIVSALIRAAERGKQVAVLVELKAQFQEQENIELTRRLEESGIDLVYGLIGLKVHAKLCLIIRREGDKIRKYVHLSTGNYNKATARIFTDIDYLTSEPEISNDVVNVFHYLTVLRKNTHYKKLLVAPFTLRTGILDLINQETSYGDEGRLIIKCNSLVDTEIIQAIYQASRSGVQVDLLIRGICCLRPGIKGVSENVRVISIIGRFLEHSRIYYFHNLGDPVIYFGSADLNSNNLDERIEILCPISDPSDRVEIYENILEMQLNDNTHAYQLGSDGSYTKTKGGAQERSVNSQVFLMHRS